MNHSLLKQQLQTEVDTAFLYQSLAENEDKADLKDIFQQMAKIEMGHADGMLKKLQGLDVKNLNIPLPSKRAKLKVKLAKVLGYDYIFSELMGLEKNISAAVIRNKMDNNEPVSGMEDNHLKILKNLSMNNGLSGGSVAKIEGRHKSVGGNALRAAVLGANDGLVSNMSLIMGVAGAISNNKSIVITGFAGLLAGAISMAMGEWLSVKNSQELHERQVALEMEELEASPEEELHELTLIYQAKGINKQKAKEMAEEVFKDKDTALSTLVQEELGFDINEKRDSAWEAAGTSFVLFVIGAIIPLIPFLLTTGNEAVIWSMIASTFGLFGIGAAITLFTGKSVLFSGMRQVAFGLVAATITYGLGKLVGSTLI